MIHAKVLRFFAEIDRGGMEEGRLVVGNRPHVTKRGIDCQNLRIQTSAESGINDSGVSGVGIQLRGNRYKSCSAAAITCPEELPRIEIRRSNHHYSTHLLSSLTKALSTCMNDESARYLFNHISRQYTAASQSDHLPKKLLSQFLNLLQILPKI